MFFSNKKILATVGAIVFVVGAFPFMSYADTREEFSITSGGDLVLYGIDFTSDRGNSGGIYFYKDTYPAVTTAVGSVTWSSGGTSFGSVILCDSFDEYTCEMDFEALFGAYGDGDYWIKLTSSTVTNAPSVWYQMERIAGLWTPVEAQSDRTRIISFTPEDGYTATTTSVNFALEAYINEVDLEGIKGIKLTLENIDQNVLLLGFLSPSNITLIDEEIEEGGYYNFASSSVPLAEGNYRLKACLTRTYWHWLTNPFDNVVEDEADCQSHQFVVVEGTFIGNISQNSFSQINDIFASTTATTTLALARSCSPVSNNVSTLYLNTNFSAIECLAFLFIPDAYYVNQTITNFKDNVSTHFPVGYLTDFYNIISTTTVKNLVVIDATLPDGVIGGGADIRLDLTGVLNPVLNATTSKFANVSASSTETLFETTNRYWTYILYFLTVLYILSRIVGKTIIPHKH